MIVEWLNVSGGVDASPDWMQSHVELIRNGYAWVGVTAQAVGLNALKAPPAQITNADTARYASLTHPGDSYSYDMFSQAGQAVRDNAEVVLGGLKPEHVIGVGESQSAGRLVTYIDAVHPLVHVYDGFLVHSRGGGGAPLTQDPLPAVGTPTPSLIRDDLDVPVLVLQMENDTGALAARRDDTSKYRLWEIAGTAHYDQYGLSLGANDTGKLDSYVDWFTTCSTRPTSRPPASAATSRSTSVPRRTSCRGVRSPERVGCEGNPAAQGPAAADGHPQSAPVRGGLTGNVQGGIRTPAVDAPIAVLGGLGNGGTGVIGQFCRLFGNTVPLTTEQLTALSEREGVRGEVEACDQRCGRSRLHPSRRRQEAPGRPGQDHVDPLELVPRSTEPPVAASP